MAGDAANRVVEFPTALNEALVPTTLGTFDRPAEGGEVVSELFHFFLALLRGDAVEEIRHGSAGFGRVGVDEKLAEILWRHAPADLAEIRSLL